MELLEAENACLTKRRRGPKPLSVRAKFAATTWLDGDILWREGRVVWRVDGREIAIGPRELESVSRALSSLKRHEKASKRHCADFDVWHARRLQQWEEARHLAAIRAPDLEALASPSRRRNPAALERLTLLLAVEGSVAEPLPLSPARALFEAWPLSQEPLKCWLRDENQPLEARALAALIMGAASPLSALPGEPWLRRAARYGSRCGFPLAPQLVVALLGNGGRDAETDVLRIEKTLAVPSLFTLDAAQLLVIHRAGNDSAQVAALAEAAHRLPDPFPALSFAPVAPKRFDADSQRSISLAWNELRTSAHAPLREILARIARRGKVRDLEVAGEVLNHLISAPVRALGALKIERGRLPRRHERELPDFEGGAKAAISVALETLKTVAEAPDAGVWELLREFLPVCPPCAAAESLSPPVWAHRWAAYAQNQAQRSLTPLLKVANCSVATAQQALRLDCWRELSRYRDLPVATLDFLLEIKAWTPEIPADLLQRLCFLARYWNGSAGARAALSPVLAALNEAEPAERAPWLDAMLGEIEWSRRGARCDLPSLARYFASMRRVRGAGGEKIAQWILVETALELRKITPNADNAAEAVAETRFRWLCDEMVRQLLAHPEQSPDWSYLPELSGLLSQLAPGDAEFQALMRANWRFAGKDSYFRWAEVKRGARLTSGLAPFQSALSANFARCPARCFALLEKLGPLDRFDSSRTPLTMKRKTASLNAGNWREILEMDAEFTPWAQRFSNAKRALEEAETPPPALLKIADWPRKIEREIVALQSRAELPPNLKTRLENLTQRLHHGAELRASMRQEMSEALQNATLEAELRAIEAAVDGCYRTRLESLGAPRNLVLDADLINAALFSTDIESNRKWLREIVRRHCEVGKTGVGKTGVEKTGGGKTGDWRREIEGNSRWLLTWSQRGLNADEWLAQAPRNVLVGGERIELRLENCPLKVLQMGNYFHTCLSRGGCNAFSSIANAVEWNKRVVFARDEKGRVVGRQLWALSGEGKLLGFHVYVALEEQNAPALRAAFGHYAREFAARCGVPLGDTGKVERLFVSDWYDDGAVAWDDLTPVEAKTVEP